MTGIEICIASLAVIVVLIYAGLYVPVALGLVSFVGVWMIRGDFGIAVNLLSASVGDSIKVYEFATIPLFTAMGLLISRARIGADVYDVANEIFRHIRGGLGIATVAANAVFAAVTGSSIASASVFSKVSVPEMIRYKYGRRFAVGTVAGSSVLGMLIPPSAMLIIYAFVAEQSIGHMFLAGVIPGVVLATAFGVSILALSYLLPKFVGGPAVLGEVEKNPKLPFGQLMLKILKMIGKLLPVVILIIVVLGGIYGGVVTAIEAGAAGALIALIIGLIMRRLSWRDLWRVLVETGHITAAILFLILCASMYSRMLGIAGLPTMFGAWLLEINLGLTNIMILYIILLVLLGTILDTASIILIVVPLFLPAIEPFGANLVWFGIVTVIGAEIGLLTPPLGISCFVIKGTIDDPSISLFDVFYGAFPFVLIMLAVLILIVAVPSLSLALL